MENNILKSTDYYYLLELSDGVEKSSERPEDIAASDIQTRIEQFEDQLDDPSMEYQERIYSRAQFKEKLDEARPVLLHEEKRALYDGIHSHIQLLWEWHEDDEREGTTNIPCNVDSVLSEIIRERILNATDLDSPMDDKASPETTSARHGTQLAKAGAGGCCVCREEEPSPHQSYRYCSVCQKGKCVACWVSWEATCREAGRAVTCGACRAAWGE